MTHDDLLGRVLSGDVPAFVVLHRPETIGPGHVEVLAGPVTSPRRLAELALPEASLTVEGREETDIFALAPYRQIAERGFVAVDDGAPLLALTVTERQICPLDEARARIPDFPIALDGGDFDVDDDQYAESVRRVVADEIGRGAGANFVVQRAYRAGLDGVVPAAALALFRRLLRGESGAYWTFVVHTPQRTLVGATPERHLSVRGGRAVMNPVSGTYRYPAAGPDLTGVLDFLADRKEAEELYMVVDEELKMMARICAGGGGRVDGPYLKEMAHLAHTEYYLHGRTDLDPRVILHETLFAPTVTGSPLESAARVIARHEPQGRGYYSGLAALIGRDGAGRRWLDSAILIRTADIDPAGRLRIGVGSTLVRHSDPSSEVAETRAKAAGLLAALGADPAGDHGPEPAADPGPDGPGVTCELAGHPRVRTALAERNEPLARFWLQGANESQRVRPEPLLTGRRVLVVDAEDTFTAMLAHQLAALDLDVTVRPVGTGYAFEEHELVVLGPGPGDPRDPDDRRLVRLRAHVTQLLAERRPFLAVCLSHQVLSRTMGLDVVRLERPQQGVQRLIGLFGAAEHVGFYNTYAARSRADVLDIPDVGEVTVSRDPHTGEVHALRGPHFASMQFHPESVLTRDGVRITGALLAHALRGAAAGTLSARGT